MTIAPLKAPANFVWHPQPEAQKLVNEFARHVLDRCPKAAELANRMKAETATRFVDWIDSIEAPDTPELRGRLENVGFERDPIEGADGRYVNYHGMFPAVVLTDEGQTRINIKVDHVDDFLAAWQIGPETEIHGEPWGRLRCARAFTGDNVELWVVERHGYRGFLIPEDAPGLNVLAMKHLETLRRRPRHLDDENASFEATWTIIDRAIADLGVDRACDLFFWAERDYWERRNRAAQVQHTRQNLLGLGWANHDHHTYRCSRHNYTKVIKTLEKMGFHCRERFYAGEEAGWGAQVLEQPVTGIIIFADVDLEPGEIEGDFPHEGLKARHELGTVGLWCALHGESMLQAGMHHLECMFDHHELVKQLAEKANIKTMDPFTTFPFLRQAFTEGERWTIDPRRIDALEQAGRITPEQAKTFREKGAIGSHLENLERNDGYKGFNQKGVSDIISRTDPRKLASAGA